MISTIEKGWRSLAIILKIKWCLRKVFNLVCFELVSFVRYIDWITVFVGSILDDEVNGIGAPRTAASETEHGMFF